MFIFHGNFSKDIHQRSQLLCFTQNDHTGHAGFKICPFLKWAQLLIVFNRRCLLNTKYHSANL